MTKIVIKEKKSSVSIKVCLGSDKPVRVKSYTRTRNGKTEYVKGYTRKSWGSYTGINLKLS